MRILPAATLLFLSALSSGCVWTEFESQPGGEIVSCDPGFVGEWRARFSGDSGGDDKERSYVLVDPNCKSVRIISDGREQSLEKEKISLGFATTGDRRILTVKGEPDKEDTSTEDGFFFFAYELKDREIRLYPVDHKRVAHLIVDGKLPGRVEITSKRPQKFAKEKTYVYGTAAEIADIVRREDLFSDRDFYVLTPATHEEILSAMKAAVSP